MSVTPKALFTAHFALNIANTEYFVPVNTVTIIDKLTATNTDSGSQTISIWLCAVGVGSGALNLLISAKSLSAGETHDFSELQNQIMGAGEQLVVQASALNKVNIRASGREIV